jgi:hypothetical protein
MHSAAPGKPHFIEKFGGKPLFSKTVKAFGTQPNSSHNSINAIAEARAQGERVRSNSVQF